MGDYFSAELSNNDLCKEVLVHFIILALLVGLLSKKQREKHDITYHIYYSVKKFSCPSILGNNISKNIEKNNHHLRLSLGF